MKVLIVSHAYVERGNHKKLEEISSFKDITIGVIYPSVWKTWHGEIKEQTSVSRITDKDKKTYLEFPSSTYFSGNGGKYFYTPFELIKTIQGFKPDVVHLEEEPWTPVALEFVLLSLVLGFKLVFFGWENINLNLGIIRDLIEGITIRGCTAAIAGNDGALLRLFKKGFTKRIIVLPQLGVDTKLFYPYDKKTVRKLLGIPLDSLVIGFVGRLVSEKGLKTLADSFMELNMANKNLVLVTSSPEKTPFIDEIIKSSSNSSQIMVFNSVTHEDLPKYLSCFDVFVLPSFTTPTWKEQFGRTLIEAMACEVPVVGSSSGAIPEVVGPAGLIFKEGDVRSLSRCLEGLSLDVRRREELSKMGLERVNKFFTFEEIAKKTVEFYSSL